MAERAGPPHLGQDRPDAGAAAVRQTQRQAQHGRLDRISARRGTAARLRDQAIRRLNQEGLPRFLALLHCRLNSPITIIWDNYSSHISEHVKQYAQQQDWLTTIQRPSYAPELNPVELLWAHAKQKIANRAFHSIDELHRAAKSALRYIQRHPELLTTFLAGASLELASHASSP
ncbi:transposase [Streptomyces sp. BA2]|uniref:transposase n=1 Tax=Streptomyces sp. BA2 TaxID=436595 RepID=UPI0013693EB2